MAMLFPSSQPLSYSVVPQLGLLLVFESLIYERGAIVWLLTFSLLLLYYYTAADITLNKADILTPFDREDPFLSVSSLIYISQ